MKGKTRPTHPSFLLPYIFTSLLYPSWRAMSREDFDWDEEVVVPSHRRNDERTAGSSSSSFATGAKTKRGISSLDDIEEALHSAHTRDYARAYMQVKELASIQRAEIVGLRTELASTKHELTQTGIARDFMAHTVLTMIENLTATVAQMAETIKALEASLLSRPVSSSTGEPTMV